MSVRLVRRLRGIGALLALICVLLSGSALATVQTAAAPAQELYRMLFPVDGPHSFVDSFGAPREGHRLHQGIDIFADKLTPVVAVADGTVRKVAVGDRAGRYIVIDHADGWSSYYLHLNNDSPGTDDGLADERVQGIKAGAKVRAGDLIDYVGDSGNAEDTPSHLHFELHRPPGIVVNPFPHLLAADGASPGRVNDALTKTDEFLPDTHATSVVGTFELEEGFAAGLAVHAGNAYLGTWGRPGVCPASGVRIIDTTDPADPQLVGALATGDEFPNTDTDSVWVGAMESAAFSGDVAVVAVSLCDNRERSRWRDDFRGLAIYDVTNPAEARLLSTLDSGERTQGVHEVDVAIRDDGRMLVAETVMQSGPHTEGVRGDVRIIDMTNPYHPLEIADWDFRRDMPPDTTADLLASVKPEQLHAHSVTFAADGERLWVANWDAGAVLLDVSEPAAPVVGNWIPTVASAEGDVHSVVSSAEMGIIVISSEDLHPDEEVGHEAGWGHQEILDLTGRSLGQYAPDDLDAEPRRDGYHTAHNAQLVDGLLFSSWYSSGLRIVDVSDPSAPDEIGYFIPPPTVDPQGYWIAPDGSERMAMVWDVLVDDELIYLSDMNTGLWIISHGDPEELRPDVY